MDVRPDIPQACILVIVASLAAWHDLRGGTIPNRVTYAGLTAGLVLGVLIGGPQGLAVALGGLLAGLLPMLVCWLIGGVGGGDLKLMAAVGALSNWRFALATLALAFAVAAVWAVFVMLRRRIFLRTTGRILRSLYLAAVTGGKGGWPEDSQSPRLAFAVAILAGAALAYLDLTLGGKLLGGMAG